MSAPPPYHFREEHRGGGEARFPQVASFDHLPLAADVGLLVGLRLLPSIPLFCKIDGFRWSEGERSRRRRKMRVEREGDTYKVRGMRDEGSVFFSRKAFGFQRPLVREKEERAENDMKIKEKSMTDGK